MEINFKKREEAILTSSLLHYIIGPYKAEMPLKTEKQGVFTMENTVGPRLTDERKKDSFLRS